MRRAASIVLALAALSLMGVVIPLGSWVVVGGGAAACNDGSDNDGDGNTDFPLDTDCDSTADETEGTVASGYSLKYVRAGAGGTASGDDWTNAYTALPASLSRGTVYYVADGSYSGYTFDDANSSTTKIIVRKATASDHGTETGWVSTYGDGQADFGALNYYTDYWVLDGKTGPADWYTGSTTGYGFAVQGTGNVINLHQTSTQNADYVSIHYTDIEGGGRDTGTNNNGVYGLFTVSGENGYSDIAFRYNAIHDFGGCTFRIRATWTLLVEHNFIARVTSTAADHCESVAAESLLDSQFVNNVWEDIEGTGVIVGLEGAGGEEFINTLVMGNWFRWTATYIGCGASGCGRPTHTYGVGGIVRVLDDASNDVASSGMRVYNNTVTDATGSFSGVSIDTATGTNYASNNIFYNGEEVGEMDATSSYNWYNVDSTADGGSNKTDCVSSCAANFTSPTADMTLANAIAGTNLSSGIPDVALKDMFGVTRGADGTWDRGAFEYDAP